MPFRPVTLVLATLVMAPPLAAQNAPEPIATPAPVKVKKERPLCREVGEIRSHFSTRVCHSAAEWLIIDRDAKDRAEIEVRKE